jgi:hypothetical protein
MCLSNGKLYGVRICIDDDINCALHIFNALKKVVFAEEAVIYGNIEAFAGDWIEESVKSELLHKDELLFKYRTL